MILKASAFVAGAFLCVSIRSCYDMICRYFVVLRDSLTDKCKIIFIPLCLKNERKMLTGCDF